MRTALCKHAAGLCATTLHKWIPSHATCVDISPSEQGSSRPLPSRILELSVTDSNRTARTGADDIYPASVTSYRDGILAWHHTRYGSTPHVGLSPAGRAALVSQYTTGAAGPDEYTTRAPADQAVAQYAQDGETTSLWAYRSRARQSTRASAGAPLRSHARSVAPLRVTVVRARSTG